MGAWRHSPASCSWEPVSEMNAEGFNHKTQSQQQSWSTNMEFDFHRRGLKCLLGQTGLRERGENTLVACGGTRIFYFELEYLFKFSCCEIKKKKRKYPCLIRKC